MPVVRRIVPSLHSYGWAMSQKTERRNMQKDQGQRAVDGDNLPSPGANSRLDFHHFSNHLSRKKPGYYLILLRSELRHRSLRQHLAPAGIDSDTVGADKLP